MNSVLLVGTANTRPGALGALFRAKGEGEFMPVVGLSAETGVQAITLHPTREGTVYAALREGVFQSNDAGESWERLPIPGAPGETFWSVAVHPQDPDILLVGCAPVGVYKSVDGGAHWRRVGTAAPMAERCDMSAAKMFNQSRLMRIAFDPSDPTQVFGACETNGFIVSQDGGETWRDASDALIALAEQHPALRSQINVPDDSEGMLDGHAVCVSPARPGLVFYACRMGLFSTADHGQSWRNHDIGKFAPITYSRDIRVDAQDPAVLYLALSISSRSAAGALYRSDDLGETWRQVDQSTPALSTVMSMGAHPRQGGRVIYVTRGGQTHWSDDGGRSWNARQLPAEAGDAYCAASL
jgi:photosystem II stability/assembly factor-like uncharacterized protein